MSMTPNQKAKLNAAYDFALEHAKVDHSAAGHTHVEPVPVPEPPPAPTPGPEPEPEPEPEPTPTTGFPLTSASTPTSAKPSLGQSIVENGIRVTCISTTKRHAYSLIEPWNADQSRLLLGFTPGSAAILDGTTYAVLRTLQIPSYASWRQEPDFIYGANDTRLVRVNINGNGSFETVHNFGSTVSIGNYEGTVSDDGRYVALTVGGRFIVWDYDASREVGNISAPSGMDGFTISRSGAYVVVRGGNTRVYPRDLSSSRVLDPKANHGAVCLIDGEDHYVGNNATAFVSGTLTGIGVTAYRLRDGNATNLLPPKTAFEYGHVSGRGPYPVLSNYDPNTMAGRPGNDQIVAITSPGLVLPFGFAHHSRLSYDAEPHAVPSRDGRRVLFASEWGGSDVYAYVSEVTA